MSLFNIGKIPVLQSSIVSTTSPDLILVPDLTQNRESLIYQNFFPHENYNGESQKICFREKSNGPILKI